MTTRGETPPLRVLARYLLKLGTVGFGGPIALVGYMQRDLVDRLHVVTENEFKDAVAFAQVAPGPLAAQVAMYCGWLRGRVLGATVAAILFVLPSFAMVLGLSFLYLRYNGLPWMQGAFYGIGAAVIAIILRSAAKLTRATLSSDWTLWGIAIANALATVWQSAEVVPLILAGGVVMVAIRSRVDNGLTRALLVGGVGALPSLPPVVQLFVYFAKAGLVVFGSGLAIVPFLHGGVVQQYHWLTEQQFVDAIAVSMITPGPVVITVAFMGYLVAGFGGATAAAVGIFFPIWLITVVAAPHFGRVAHNVALRAFVAGVSAGATGAIAGAAVVIGRRAVHDAFTLAVALLTLIMIVRVKRVPEPLLILTAGVLGILVRRS